MDIAKARLSGGGVKTMKAGICWLDGCLQREPLTCLTARETEGASCAFGVFTLARENLPVYMGWLC